MKGITVEAARDQLERCNRQAENITGQRGLSLRALLRIIETAVAAEEAGEGELTDEQELMLQELRMLTVVLNSSAPAH